jgi:PAS domain S-box-containing protein
MGEYGDEVVPPPVAISAQCDDDLDAAHFGGTIGLGTLTAVDCLPNFDTSEVLEAESLFGRPVVACGGGEATAGVSDAHPISTSSSSSSAAAVSFSDDDVWLEGLDDHLFLLPGPPGTGVGMSRPAPHGVAAKSATGKRKYVEHIDDHRDGRATDGEADQLLAQLRGVVGGASTKETLARALAQLSGPAPAANRSPGTPQGLVPAHQPVPHHAIAQQMDLYDSHGFAMVIMDMSGDFVTWNSTVQNLLGYSPEEMYGLNMGQVTPAEDMPGMQRMIQGISQMQHGLPTAANPIIMHKRCVLHSGECVHVPVRLSVLGEAHAAALGWPGGRMLSCLIDCHTRVSPYAWNMPVSADAAGKTNPVPELGHSTGIVSVARHGVPQPEQSPGIMIPSTQQRPPHRRCKRVPLPMRVVEALREAFAHEPHPTILARKELAHRYGIDRSKVDKWFENARARGGGGGRAPA